MTKDDFQGPAGIKGKTEKASSTTKPSAPAVVHPFMVRSPSLEPKPPFGMPVAIKLKPVPQIVAPQKKEAAPHQTDTEEKI